MFIKLTSLALLVVLGTSCSTLKSIAQRPKLNFNSLDVAGLSLSGATFLARFDVENPNGFDIKIDQVNYGLKINDRDLTTGKLEQPVEIKGRKSRTVEFPIRIKYADLIRVVRDFAQTKKTAFLLAGSVSSGPFEVPFEEKGELELPVLTESI